MCDRKHQNNELIKSMVHGKPSRHKHQNSQSGIYDIFNWRVEEEENKKQDKILNSNRGCGNMVKSWVVQDKRVHNHACNCGRYCQVNQEVLPVQKQQPEIIKNGVAEEYMIGKPKKHLKPHPVKHQLYSFDKVNLKRNHSEEANYNKTQLKKTKAQIIQQNKLNENDQRDKQIIQKRKLKIKQFKQFTRQLPNSAFTTYYGRPAFQSYGRCNSNSQLKTHNVMPHRGENHPKVKQTYESALIKGKNVKIQGHLPRKPIESKHNEPNIQKNKEKLIHLPLERPDLINHVRFSEPEQKSLRKQPIPSFEKLKKEIKKKAETKKSKSNKDKKAASQQSDGLKFMNTRDHLIQLIQQKKLKDSKLAYKVTECYPDRKNEGNKTQNSEDYQKAAGMPYKRDQPAENIIYRRY